MASMADPLLFQKTLQDLIKGIRSHRKDPSAFISKGIAEIKTELRSSDAFVKAEAVRKLTYLQMIGYNVSWASFGIVEVMSQQRFAHKRIGYLAANQTFDDSTDVILLTTNLFKKEFTTNMNQNQYEVAMAVNCLANIATKELARDCISDLVTLMNHSRPYIRKKAILAMYKLYIKFPQGLRLTFDKLKDRLDDPESSVVCTAVNVICELANKNPKNYLAMAPKFFKLLTTSSNNWMLIKVVKLLSSLVTEEPRLARKLLDPLATIIQNTSAKSLQYECIYTITEALPYSRREDGSEAKNAAHVITICSTYLKGFIEDADQNLKYLGLVGLCNLMKSSPRSVVDHRDLVLGCLNDDDVTIRLKSLELLAGIASKRSLVDLVHHLLEHAKRSEGSYRDEITSKILFMCRKEKYSLVSDFTWYCSILLELAVMQGHAKHGFEVAEQLIEIALRVPSVRAYAVDCMLGLILDERLMLGHARLTVVEVLRAAGWIVGEYCEIVTKIAMDTAEDNDFSDDNSDEENDNDQEGKPQPFYFEGPLSQEESLRSIWRGQPLHYLLLKSMLSSRTCGLPIAVQIVYLQASIKIFIQVISMQGKVDFAQVADVIGILRNGLPLFVQNLDLEVQERANTLRYLLHELKILPLDWETKVDFEESQQKSRVLTREIEFSLLDLTGPIYTASSVRNIDEQGARVALESHKQKQLASLTKERFYAVHSKAQRRVPLPQGLDLTEAFNQSALGKLMKLELPQDLQLSALVFVKEREVLLHPLNGGVSTSNEAKVLDKEELRLSRLIEDDIFGDRHSHPRGPSVSFKDKDKDKDKGDAASVATGTTGHTSKASSQQSQAERDPYMLGNNNNSKLRPDLIPLSTLLGDFEDIPSGKKTKKSKKSSSSVKKRAAVAMDQREMLPATGGGEDENEDDEDNNDSGKGKGKSRGGKHEDHEADLSSVDITQPLQPDEALPVLAHRVVPDHVISKKSSSKKSKEAAGNGGDGEKTRKKKRKGKGSADVDDLLGSASAAEGDLLTLDWQPTAAPSVPAHAAVVPGLLDTVPLAADEGGKGGKKTKKSSSSSQSKSEQPLYFYSFHSSRHAEINYAVRVDNSEATSLSIAFESTNVSSSSGAVSAAVDVQPHALIRHITPKTSVALARNLPPRASFASAVSIALASPLTENLTVSTILHLTTEGLVGPDAIHISVPLKVHAVVAFAPYVLDSQAFADKLNKASAKWSKRSVTISLSSSKAKVAFKRLAEFLHAHLVESESSKAAMMAARAPSGCKVFIMCKAGGSGGSGTAAVDLKCLGSSEQESAAVAAVVGAALESELF